MLPASVITIAKQADFIIHAGDFTSLDCLEQIRGIAPLVAVRGNMDSAALVARLPEKTLFETDGMKIGIVHGSGSHVMAMRLARDAFDRPDLIVFGHTHVPVIQQLDGVQMINPGSPTQPRSGTGGTAGWVTIDSAGISCRIVHLDGEPNGGFFVAS